MILDGSVERRRVWRGPEVKQAVVQGTVDLDVARGILEADQRIAAAVEHFQVELRRYLAAAYRRPAGIVSAARQAATLTSVVIKLPADDAGIVVGVHALRVEIVFSSRRSQEAA